MDTRTKIINALKQMLEADESISIHSVADKCGVSHSLIYNRYPDLKERIKELKDTQKERRKAASDQDIIANLMAKNKVLQAKAKGESRTQETDAFKGLLAHVQEVYSMYDSLLDERNKLAERLAAKK